MNTPQNNERQNVQGNKQGGGDQTGKGNRPSESSAPTPGSPEVQPGETGDIGRQGTEGKQGTRMTPEESDFPKGDDEDREGYKGTDRRGHTSAVNNDSDNEQPGGNAENEG